MPNRSTIEQYRRATVYLAPADKQRLDTAAQAAGVSVSTLLRRLLIEAGIVEDVMLDYGTPGQGRRSKQESDTP